MIRFNIIPPKPTKTGYIDWGDEVLEIFHDTSDKNELIGKYKNDHNASVDDIELLLHSVYAAGYADGRRYADESHEFGKNWTPGCMK